MAVAGVTIEDGFPGPKMDSRDDEKSPLKDPSVATRSAVSLTIVSRDTNWDMICLGLIVNDSDVLVPLSVYVICWEDGFMWMLLIDTTVWDRPAQAATNAAFVDPENGRLCEKLSTAFWIDIRMSSCRPIWASSSLSWATLDFWAAMLE